MRAIGIWWLMHQDDLPVRLCILCLFISPVILCIRQVAVIRYIIRIQHDKCCIFILIRIIDSGTCILIWNVLILYLKMWDNSVRVRNSFYTGLRFMISCRRDIRYRLRYSFQRPCPVILIASIIYKISCMKNKCCSSKLTLSFCQRIQICLIIRCNHSLWIIHIDKCEPWCFFILYCKCHRCAEIACLAYTNPVIVSLTGLKSCNLRCVFTCFLCGISCHQSQIQQCLRLHNFLSLCRKCSCIRKISTLWDLCHSSPWHSSPCVPAQVPRVCRFSMGHGNLRRCQSVCHRWFLRSHRCRCRPGDRPSIFIVQNVIRAFCII